MTRIVEHNSQRLVVKSDHRFAFGIAISLGLFATVGTIAGVINHGNEFNTNDIFGIILGPLFLFGSPFLYRETTTIFDKKSRLATWNQLGLTVNKSDSAQFADIHDVVVGRPVSDQSGGATGLVLILADRHWPLSFGFSALNHQDKEIVYTIKALLMTGSPDKPEG